MHYFRRMMDYEEQVALCALNKIFGYHPRLAMALIEETGSAAAVFSAPDLEVPGHPELAERVEPAMLDWAEGELTRIRERGFRFLTYKDSDYPAPLLEIPDPPLGIYLNGSTPPTQIFDLHPMVGVVGTRDLSPYGRAWCRKLVEGLSRAKVQPCIVSGMALGADGIAHQTALECGLTTVGVLPTGIDKIYPWQHERLAMQMVETPGCGLVTDYPSGTAPVALNFLRRNRIIAGLTRAVIVVESKSQGGSLMTARYAVEYGRDVYALPGRVDDIRSAGCNSLIHQNMAEIITTPEDLVARLGLGAPSRKAAVIGPNVFADALERQFGAGSIERAVGLGVQKNRGVTVEELSALMRQPFAATMTAVSTLEAAGFVRMDLLRRCSLAPEWE